MNKLKFELGEKVIRKHKNDNKIYYEIDIIQIISFFSDIGSYRYYFNKSLNIPYEEKNLFKINEIDYIRHEIFEKYKKQFEELENKIKESEDK